MTITIPLRVENPLNKRQHWRVVSRRGKHEKTTTANYLRLAGKLPPLPVVVMLTRIGRGVFDDDAVPASLKHVRDSIAKTYGVDDGDKARIRFTYDQEKAKDYAVRIEIVPV